MKKGFSLPLLISIILGLLFVIVIGIYIKNITTESFPKIPATNQQVEPTTSPSPSQNDNNQPPIVQIVKKDLADLLKIPENSIEVLSVEKAEWPDSCLGVDTGQLCAQVITPGYKISLRGTGNRIYIYHTDLNKNFILEPQIRGNL